MADKSEGLVESVAQTEDSSRVRRQEPRHVLWDCTSPIPLRSNQEWAHPQRDSTNRILVKGSEDASRRLKGNGRSPTPRASCTRPAPGSDLCYHPGAEIFPAAECDPGLLQKGRG